MSALRQLVHEIHRRSLWQVLGIYAVASWVIYQVVVALYEGIGLPSWVPGTALVLLLIGLPIVLATAFIQEGGPGLGGQESDGEGAEGRVAGHETTGRVAGLETTADTVGAARGETEERGEAATAAAGPETGDATAAGAAPSPTGNTTEPSAAPSARGGPDPSSASTPASDRRREGLFTWSRAITGGVLAFAALGLAATGFMGMRALGIGPAATLISSGELEERTEVLVADFESPAADSLTANALAEALRIDLSQAQTLAVVDPAEVGPALARMELDPATPLTEDVARELAVREGIPVVLVGDLTPVGSGYQITARLIRPDSNRVLLRVRERADAADDVLPAMDRLTERLLERTGESLRAIRSAGRLAAYTTSSLDALKIYSQAQRVAVLENDDRRAEELLESALREDSTFAMAWRKLGAVRANSGDRTGAVEAYTRAFELSDRLPEAERLRAAASYYFDVDYDPTRVIDAYERLLELDPRDGAALNNLSLMYADRGDWERALETMDRAVQADSTALSLSNLALYAMAVGDTARSREVLEVRLRMYPDNQTNDLLVRDLLYARGGVAELRSRIDTVLARTTRALPRQAALWDRAWLEIREGRLEDGVSTLEVRRDVRDQADLPAGQYLLNLYWVHQFVTGDTAQARAYLDRFMDAVWVDIPALDRPYLVVASAHAMLGDADQAREMLLTWERTVPEELRRAEQTPREWATGLVALAEGREEKGLQLLRRSTEQTDQAHANRLFLAWGYDTTGRPDSALAAYHRFEATPHWDRLWVDGHGLALAYERLGALHEARGDRAEAAEYYSRFVDLWENADPALQPRVDAARRALARLASEGSG